MSSYKISKREFYRLLIKYYEETYTDGAMLLSERVRGARKFAADQTGKTVVEAWCQYEDLPSIVADFIEAVGYKEYFLPVLADIEEKFENTEEVMSKDWYEILREKYR